MGNPVKPQAIRDLEGDRSHGSKAAVKVAMDARGKPVIPAHLGKYEQEVWRMIMRSAPPRLYAEMDSVILSAYCVAAGLHREAVLKVAEEGATQPTVNGTMTQSPWILIMAKQVQVISSLGSRLGLDPVARMGLGSPEEKPQSKFGQLLVSHDDLTG